MRLVWLPDCGMLGLRVWFEQTSFGGIGRVLWRVLSSFAGSPVGLNAELLKHVCVGFYGS